MKKINLYKDFKIFINENNNQTSNIEKESDENIQDINQLKINNKLIEVYNSFLDVGLEYPNTRYIHSDWYEKYEKLIKNINFKDVITLKDGTKVEVVFLSYLDRSGPKYNSTFPEFSPQFRVVTVLQIDGNYKRSLASLRVLIKKIKI